MLEAIRRTTLTAGFIQMNIHRRGETEKKNARKQLKQNTEEKNSGSHNNNDYDTHLPMVFIVVFFSVLAFCRSQAAQKVIFFWFSFSCVGHKIYIYVYSQTHK